MDGTGPIYGFEDVLGHPLGEGHYYNSFTSLYQLVFALSVASSPDIERILADTEAGGPDLVGLLREHQVLAGTKMLDLGCGLVAGIAIAAKTLGAESYTADAEALPEDIEAKLDGHTVIDLVHAEASEVLLQATGGQFDVVTENIIASIPNEYHSGYPGADATAAIGATLLKPAGYFYHVSADPMRLS